MTAEELRDFCRDGSRRLGIMGGTFDPIHLGHMQLCQAARAEFDLDCVLLLVSGNPPHKPQNASDKETRFAMAALAAAHTDGLCASRIEIDRPGRTYTVDTLHALRDVLPIDTALFYIIGADTLLSIETWERPNEVFALTNFISFSRPGLDDDTVAQYVRHRLRGYSERIYFARERGPMISSTDIRRRVAQGLPTDGLLPEYVRAYIDNNGLYRGAALSFAEVEQKLQNILKPTRFAHTRGVIAAAAALAERYGVAIEEARWAALLHDCAKEMRPDQMIAACDTYGVVLDSETRRAPQLIHAPLGAAIARNVYGMEHEGILDAIACHSTGRAGMTTLDKVLFLADLIEPCRAYPGVETLRDLATRDLNRAVLAGMDQTIRHVLDTVRTLHPDTVIARNDLINRGLAHAESPFADSRRETI